MSPLFLSLCASSFLFIVKFAGGIYTNSAGLQSEAIHSSVDVLSAFFALTATHLAKEHLAKYTEALLLLVGAGWALRESSDPHHSVANPLLGVIICGVSLIVYILLYLNNHAHSHSAAIQANLTHVLSDIGSTIVTLLALILVAITGSFLFDQIAAIVITFWLFYLAYCLVKK